MKTRNFLIVLALFALLAMVVSACGSATPQTVEVIKTVEVVKTVEKTVVETVEKKVVETVEKTVVETVEVTPEPTPVPEISDDDIVTVTWWGTERGRDTAATRDLHFQLARAFEETHPNTKIAVSLFPSRGFSKRVLTAIAANQGPDIWYHYFATDIATQGFLEDLTPYMEADGVNPEERWFPIGQQRATYNGHYYGVPRDATAGFIAYNKDMFDAAGIPYPEEGWTIDDYRNIALQLTDADNDQYGVGAIVGSTGCFQWSSFSFNMGADFVSLDGKKVDGYMNTPEAINAMQYCLGLTADDHVTAPSGLQEQFGELVFVSGKIGMQHISTWELPAIREQADFNWGVVAPPRFNENTDEIAWTDSYMMYMWSGSPHKQRAWEFLNWLSGPEAAKIMAESGIWTPAVPQVWEDMGWDKDPVLSVPWKELHKETRVANYERSQFYWDCVGGIFDDLWTNYVELGDKDIEGFIMPAVSDAQMCLDDNYASLQ